MSRARTLHPARSLSAVALAAFAGSAFAVDPAAEIRELKARIEALEKQQAAQAAAPAPAVNAPAPAPAPAPATLGQTTFSWGGYIKLDTIYSRFSEGEVAQGTSRDFYVPGTIPVSSGGGDSRDFLDFHAKSTRLFFKTETPFDNGQKVGTHVEMDFIVNQSTTANERVTNAYNPGFRRAFITYSNWLAGQEWSTFQNLSALPDSLDFVEFPSEGTVFIRQPMLRYAYGGLMLAIENPETTLLPNGGGTTFDSGDATAPDLVARYNLKFGAGHEVSLAGLVRQLKLENAAGSAVAPDTDDSATGVGASLAGKFVFGSDDLKFMLSGGRGIGRYIALATSADAVVDGDGNLEEIDVLAGYLAYKHAWTPKLRSTLLLSAFSADNDTDLTGTAVTKEVQSAAINLLYSPVPRLTVGGEFRHAEREVESGADGDLDRLQFSVRYNLY